MDIKNYLNTYVEQARKEGSSATNPEWMRKFFCEFAEGVEKRIKQASKGDRYIVTKPFAGAFHYLLPPGVTWNIEQSLSNYLDVSESGSVLANMLKKKRVDISVEREPISLLIEFKTNLTFNDLSAAIAEMALVKASKHKGKIRTGALQLYPAAWGIDALSELNRIMGAPLDAIWVLCRKTKSSFEFDLPAIESMRTDIERLVSP